MSKLKAIDEIFDDTEFNGLTESQKEVIISTWGLNQTNPPKVSEVIERVFGRPLDTRTKQGRAVRDFLVENAIPYGVARDDYVNPDILILSEEQREFIRNHMDMKASEIARTLFPDVKLHNFSKEVRTVNLYLREIGGVAYSLNDKLYYHGPTKPPEDLYISPKTQQECIRKINEYASAGWTYGNLPPVAKRCVESCIIFMRAPRFVEQMNTYKTEERRRAFEAEYVRAVYDKPDLTTDELNLYINLCNDYIICRDISRQIEKLNEMLDNVVDDPEGKTSISLAETISTKTGEYNNCIKRQKDLIDTLNGKRSDRQKKAGFAYASVANLFEFFKEEKNRATLKRISELNKRLIKEELDRVETMDDVIGSLFGVSREEVLQDG